MNTLRATKDTKAASWALTTNLVYRSMVGEVYGFEPISLESIIGKGFDIKQLYFLK